jgi:hypothetical protein
MNTKRLVVSAVGVALLALPVTSAVAQQPPPNSPEVEGHDPNITYRDASGDVHVVRVQNEGSGVPRANAGDYDISKPGWPKATGTPTGYSSRIDPGVPEEHVIYRASTGHLIELWKPDISSTWNKTDLMSAAGTKVKAAGDAVGWSHDSLGRQWIVYRATTGQIHGLTWTKKSGHWKDVNLSAAAHAKVLAAADPTVFIESVSKTPRPVVVYRANDKHVHVLIWTVGTSGLSWHGTDLSDLAKFKGAPLSKPYGWASKAPATTVDELHVVFRTANGHIQELYGSFGHPWKRNDLTAVSKAKVHAVGDIQGTVGTDELLEDYEAVQYKGTDGDLHWMTYSVGHHWVDNDLSVTVSRIGLWFQDGGNAYTGYVTGSHLWVLEREWEAENTDINDQTTLFGASTHPATSTGGYFTTAPITL